MEWKNDLFILLTFFINVRGRILWLRGFFFRSKIPTQSTHIQVQKTHLFATLDKWLNTRNYLLKKENPNLFYHCVLQNLLTSYILSLGTL